MNFYRFFSQELSRTKGTANDMETSLKEKEQFLGNEQSNNRQLEQNIAKNELIQRKLREDFQDLEQTRDQFSQEVVYFAYWLFLLQP